MIRLTENLALAADEHSFLVGKPCLKPNGEAFIRNPRYFPNVRLALQGALEIALRTAIADETITTLRELMEVQERLAAQLKDLLAPLEVQP